MIFWAPPSLRTSCPYLLFCISTPPRTRPCRWSCAPRSRPCSAGCSAPGSSTDRTCWTSRCPRGWGVCKAMLLVSNFKVWPGNVYIILHWHTLHGVFGFIHWPTVNQQNNQWKIVSHSFRIYCAGDQSIGTLRGAVLIKNVTHFWKRPKGGGVSSKNQKVHYSKCGILWDNGGGWIFKFFQNSNDWNMVLILIIYRWYIGKI